MEQVLRRVHAPHSLWRPAFARLRLWLDLWHERRMLARLDRRMLADIGIEEGAAALEASRPMWEIPAARDIGGRYGLDR